MSFIFRFLIPVLLILFLPVVASAEQNDSFILDFLNMNFSDTANTTNVDVQPDINWEETSKSRAWVDIVGWDNMIERNGVFYVPEGQEPIILFEAENTASRPVSTQTDVTYKERKGVLKADLKVKAVYEIAKKTTKTVNGISVPSIELVKRSLTAYYHDSEPIPETYIPAINTTAYLTIINNSMESQTRIYIPESPDVIKVLFEFNDTQTWHYLHTCAMNETEKGVKYAQISDLDYWEGDNVSRLGDALTLPGTVDPEQIRIVQYDIYGQEIPIDDYQIEMRNQDEKSLIAPITYLFFGVVGIFLLGTYKIIGVFI